MAWTDERVEQLKALWAEGKTAAEIAKVLGEVSRNAVIGKAHRLGLSNRVQTQKGAEVEPEEPKKLVKSSPKKKATSKAALKNENTNAEAVADDALAQNETKAKRAKTERKAKEKAAAPVEELKPKKKAAAAEPAIELEELELDELDEEDEEAVNPVAALAAEAEKNAKKLSLLELNERTCKWPIGDPSTDDFFFCGHPCAPEKPYCSVHVQVAYQPMSSRRDRERERARGRAASA